MKRKAPQRSDVFEALWKDPRYLRAHARKDARFKEWNHLDAYKTRSYIKTEDVEKALKRAKHATKRIETLENLALRKAGFRF